MDDNKKRSYEQNATKLNNLKIAIKQFEELVVLYKNHTYSGRFRHTNNLGQEMKTHLTKSKAKLKRLEVVVAKQKRQEILTIIESK